MTRPILATIHTDALRHNLTVARRHAPNSRMMAVIKANGYGHGLLRVASALRDADGFAVLNVSEGVALREAGYAQQTILLLEGLFSADELAVAARHRLAIVVHSEPQLLMLERAKGLPAIDVFLKVNTGMNRLGVPLGRFWSFYDRLRACASVGQLTLMTHFATADEPPGIEKQFELFDGLTSQIPAPRTMANSAAILRYPQTHTEWVRPGIMLYGASPYSDLSFADLDLHPAMTLGSEIIAIQAMQPGDAVGYGRRFIAEKPTRVGVVACGYADGYPRHAPNGTPIAVAGKLTRTIGRVSMDMLYADLTGIPEADLGSPVELWGAQVSVDAVAQASGTVGYELLCALAPRVPVEEN
ncbi:alanine racemase [Methylobacillus sp. MM3]|uniref:alanine racemase n=1 Tax=Methylobacillus sp. MM3 TaxID=1848039 RepID=UPI0007E0D9E2|nr:alanine racemase [Methylobacillus sp. MM3]OAJ71646.1 alanine racemase [Methylobacillus sp. MM3]